MAPRKTEPLDRAALEAAALAYLERYATSAANLRRVLLRKIRARGGDDAEALVAHVDVLIERYVGARLLDDATYARARAASLHRRGESSRGIRAKLEARGVGRDDAAAALGALREERGDANLDEAAARRLAERRRLGPFRADAEARAARRNKDVAFLVRRGFDYGVARTVIDGAKGDEDDYPT